MSAPSLPQDGALASTPREGDESNNTPESQAGGSLSRHRIKFRNILGPNRHQGKTSNTSPSEATSISPLQPRTNPSPRTQVETRWTSWWHFKKRRNTYEERDAHSVSGSMAQGAPDREDAEEGDDEDLAALAKPWSRWKSAKNRRANRFPGVEAATVEHENEGESIRGKSRREVGRGQKVRGKKSKTAEPVPSPEPGRASQDWWKRSGPKQPRHRKSISSAHARPSATGTSSTPGNGTAHRDFGHEDWRETPSPMTPNQVLRLFLGSGRPPTSRTTTQLELVSPEAAPSTSTLHFERPSRDARALEHKYKTWASFWGSPKPQPEPSSGEDVEGVSRQEDNPESASQKRPWARVYRKRWRSG
ncbi:hypothetical protein F4677DRAFT_348662 [Hypoxylon crocopeplum]|nr:hypothetical protein F4677DRAFT_348662 [Hypoxylon crocopeplum]